MNEAKEIIIRDSRAICPKCSGLITPGVPYVWYKCRDCHTYYETVENGYNEYGVVVKERQAYGK